MEMSKQLTIQQHYPSPDTVFNSEEWVLASIISADSPMCFAVIPFEKQKQLERLVIMKSQIITHNSLKSRSTRCNIWALLLDGLTHITK